MYTYILYYIYIYPKCINYWFKKQINRNIIKLKKIYIRFCIVIKFLLCFELCKLQRVIVKLLTLTFLRVC